MHADVHVCKYCPVVRKDPKPRKWRRSSSMHTYRKSLGYNREVALSALMRHTQWLFQQKIILCPMSPNLGKCHPFTPRTFPEILELLSCCFQKMLCCRGKQHHRASPHCSVKPVIDNCFSAWMIYQQFYPAPGSPYHAPRVCCTTSV